VKKTLSLHISKDWCVPGKVHSSTLPARRPFFHSTYGADMDDILYQANLLDEKRVYLNTTFIKS